MKWLILKLCWCILLTIATTIADGVSNDGKLSFYHLPNPFTNSKENGFFYIKSYQTVVSRENKRTTLEVNEYFSLKKGFSYSIHRDMDGEGKYALVSDGKDDRSYIIHNPDEENEKLLACELDSVHNHRQIFPWQFNYDLPSKTNTDDANFSSRILKKNKKKGSWLNKRSIYGVAAIWLNAIELGVVTDKVGDNSLHSSSITWIMNNYDLNVELSIDKPIEFGLSPDQMQAAIDRSSLVSINIKRFFTPNTYSYAGTILGATATEMIEIDQFVMNLDLKDYGIIRMFSQLKHCRRENQDHRVFPSLMRAISLSPKHMYELDYLETRFGHVATGKVNDFREVRNPELVFELFSVPYESQVIDYQGVINITTSLYDQRVDTYLKRFTERASGLWSTSHATAEYHIVRHKTGEETCMINEPDPAPLWFDLLLRPFIFWRPNNIQLRGVITGLGALLMNANDMHYKEFNLLQKTIEVMYDPNDINARAKMNVEEWRLTDIGQKRVHFYFKQPTTAKSKYDLTSLVRVEVRRLKQEHTEDPIEDSSVDNLNDEDLMIRWDIFGFHVHNTDDALESFFHRPDFCPEVKPLRDEEHDTSTDYLDGVATLPPFVEDFDPIFDDEATDTDDEQDNDRDRKHGEDFEFEPGMSSEGHQIPDFFNLFNGGKIAYSALTKIELFELNTNSKVIYLREIVDMELNLASISVFYEQYNDENATPDLEYFIDYNSEVILKNTGNQCEVVENVETWIRLVSVDLAYWKKNPSQSVTEESHKLRQFGVGALWRFATMSGETSFSGQTRVARDENGHRYKRLLWKSLHNGDYNLPILFEFELNVTEASVIQTATSSALSLKSIRFKNFFPNWKYESLLKNVKFTVVKFENFLRKKLDLPDNCMSAIDKKPFFSDSPNLPTFVDFLGNATGYIAEYYVTRSDAETKDGVHMDRFEESYHLKSTRGKLITGMGENTKAVFLEGSTGCIYLYAQDTCKLLTSMVAFNTGVDMIDNDHGTLFGIANIWKIASTLGEPTRKTTLDYGKYGNEIKLSSYSLRVRNHGTLAAIRFEFILTAKNSFELVKIVFNEVLSNQITTKKISTTIVNVMNFQKITGELSWNLPEDCLGLCAADTSGPTQGTPTASNLNQLPDITKIIAPLGKFYMRSEVVLPKEYSRTIDKSNYYYIVDEWFFNGDYRIKSYAQGKNHDDIVYTTTEEQFDISEPYTCTNKHEISGTPSRVLPPLLKLWKGYQQLPVSLLDYHFGPASIWRLAEANKNLLEMISSINLTPRAGTTEQQTKAMDRQMGSRMWQLSHPDGHWLVNLEFLKESVPDNENGGRNEWLVLNGITITQREGSTVSKIEIDVVNYEYSKSDEEMQQKLLLPEGYGCQRSLKKMDSLGSVTESAQMFHTLSHSIWYESSLEKIELANNDYGIIPIKTKTVLPSVTGTFHKSSKQIIQPHMSIWSDLNTIRFANGTIQSTKTVHDMSNNMHFSIDRMTGHCVVSSNANSWSIKYPTHDHEAEENLVLDDETFGHLFMKPGAFQPLNSYERRGTVYITYEESGDNLKLTSTLSGPYSIIRSFQYNQASGKRNLKRFDSMVVKVFLFDQRRVDRKAILIINLRKMANVPMTQVLENIDVSTCFNNGDQISDNPIRRFEVVYVCNDTVDNSETVTSLLKDSFSRSFIQQTGIYVTQLVRAPSLEMSHSGEIKFTLNLIDAPTFILQDVKYYPHMRMSNVHQSKARFKLTADIMECSKICDNLKCVAMSYCSDHFCYALGRKDITDDYLGDLKSPQPDPNCNYYSLEHKNAPTIDSLSQIFEQIKPDDPRSEIFPLATGQYCSLLYPVRVTELTEPSELDESMSINKQHVAGGYNEIGRNNILDLSKLHMLTEKGFGHSLESVESINGCLKRCEEQNCVMVSFCNSQLVKCVIVTGSGDVKELPGVVAESTQGKCMVLARDYTSQFKRFKGTTKPSSSAREYRGLSDKQCAAQCVLSDTNQNERCLSFDHCLIKSPAGVVPTCFIQNTHVYSDDFEKTIFESTRKLEMQGKDMQSCQHFSRNFLADYQRLADKKLKVKYTQIESDVEPDRCAYNCNNNDNCYAFVHCESRTGGFCMILMDNSEKQFQSKNDALRYFNEQSYESKICSIYVRNTYFQDFYLSDRNAEAMMNDVVSGGGLVKFLIKITIYLHVALIVGITTRLLIIRILR